MEHFSGNSSVHIHEACGKMTTAYTENRFEVHIDRCPKVKKDIAMCFIRVRNVPVAKYYSRH